MVRRSYSAVVQRNILWDGEFQTAPYEAGWASEAIFFVRSMERSGKGTARVQITLEGMRWCDEGSRFSLPAEGQVTFGRT